MKKYLMMGGIGLLATLVVIGFSVAATQQPNQPEWKPLEQAPSQLIEQFERDHTRESGTIQWKGSKFLKLSFQHSILYFISTLPLRTSSNQTVCGVGGCIFAGYLSQGQNYRPVTSGLVHGKPEILQESQKGFPCLKFEQRAVWCYDGKQYTLKQK